MKIKKELFNRKMKIDTLTKSLIFVVSTLALLALFLMFVFILKEAFPAYQKHGFWHMYTTSKFTEAENYGIWGPLTATLMVSILAVIIATPIAIRTSFFISFRAKKATKRILGSFINILAGVPSIIFGLFAFFSLSKFTGLFIGGDAANTLLNGSLMLAIMIIPTMVSLIINQVQAVPRDLINSALALGNSKTYVIYSIVRKKLKSGIAVAVILGLGRAIGETMALSMILNTTGTDYFENGFFELFKSPLMTLGLYIAKFYFTEGGVNTEYLFAAGIALFVVIMILILIVNQFTKVKLISYKNPYQQFQYLKSKHKPDFNSYLKWLLFFLKLPFLLIGWALRLIASYFKMIINYFVSLIMIIINKYIYKSKPKTDKFVAFNNSWFYKFNDYRKLILEIICITLILVFCSWIVLDVLINGIKSWTGDKWKYSYQLPKKNAPTLGQIANPLVWTLVFIILVLVISFPISLLTAIYLSEYARGKRMGNIIRFFLDALSGTPSILFGIFGSIFFIETLNLRAGRYRYSMIAGALTMLLVVLPTFTRSIEQSLLTVPQSHRQASLALGASKTKTIFRVVVPQSMKGIVTGVVLSSGRILAETAPVYLTLGAAAIYSPISLIGQPGHTITTSIVNLVWGTGKTLHSQMGELYGLGSVAIILSAFISLLAETLNLQIKYIYKPIHTFIKKTIYLPIGKLLTRKRGKNV